MTIGIEWWKSIGAELVRQRAEFDARQEREAAASRKSAHRHKHARRRREQREEGARSVWLSGSEYRRFPRGFDRARCALMHSRFYVFSLYAGPGSGGEQTADIYCRKCGVLRFNASAWWPVVVAHGL